MLELLRGLSPLQWVLVVGGLLMIIPTVKNFFSSKDGPTVNLGRCSSRLTAIVHKWEVLNNACAEAGLEEPEDKLREVFLVLANKRLIDPKPTPPVEKKDEEVQ